MEKIVPASRIKRLLARLIDETMLLPIYAVITYVAGMFLDSEYISRPFIYGDIFFTLSRMIFFLLNYKFLVADGQTVGKKLLSIQIITMDDKIPSLWKSFIARDFFLVLLYYAFRRIITVYFIRQYLSLFFLCDVIFIFHPDRRCIHDFLAGTKVIDKVQFLAGARFRAQKETEAYKAFEEQSFASDFQLARLARFEKEILHSTSLRYKRATRTDRFLGYVIDKIAILIGFALINYALKRNYPTSLLQMLQKRFVIDSVFFLFLEFILAFILINAYFLVKNQQTLGKVCLGIKIVGMDQTRVSLLKILFLREILFWGPWSFLSVFPEIFVVCYLFSLLINALFIYRQDRRCLHDWACQTRVVCVP
jgi:uncharacterized RDD family membrane protein YckC